MEYRFKMMKKIVLAFLAFSMFSACGYLDNDGIKYRKSIVGNISIQQFGGTDENRLVFEGANGMTSVIVGDCHTVYYDSIKNVIYVESPITELTSSYYRIVLTNPSSPKRSEALKKDIIDKSTFKKGIAKKSATQVKLE
jgi:hypothetical protein